MKTKLQEFAPSEKQRQPFNKKKYEKKVEKQIEEQAIKIISQLQEQQVDPLGLGAKYKEQYRAFNKQEWETYYPDVEVSVKADVKIEQTGTVD